MKDLIDRLNANPTDTIYRNDAVDALAYFDERSPTGKTAQDIIIGLPSVQPEIVRCGQCKYAEVADAQDNQDGYICQFHRGSIWFSGSYCSWGERRTDEGD